MSIFSQFIQRLGRTRPSRRTMTQRTRLVRFEPLEERRLLNAAPNNFVVAHDPEVTAGLILTWDLAAGATQGYEIQSSISGLNDEANPDLWKTGLWDVAKTVTVGTKRLKINRYRGLYFRIQSLPVGESPEWSTIEYVSAPPEDNVVKVSAAVLTGPDTIKLQWPEELKFANSEYTISRKAKDDTVWVELATDVSDNFYEDKVTAPVDPIQVGKAYEYRVQRCSTAGCQFSPSGTGYVYAGIDFTLSDADSTIESPGTVILIVDDTQAAALANELDRLENDLIAEGWGVKRHDVVRHNDVPASNTHDDVHALILGDYTTEANVTTVLLIGHVPIPMSGWNNPDGHLFRPMPADVYYGDMDVSLWTDTQFLGTGNIIGDGIFDRQTVPTDVVVEGVPPDGKPVELMVGRVDMSDLPNFGIYNPGLTEAQLETELLRRYLDKDHAFRTGQVAVERKARIRDRFARTYSSTGAWQTLSGFFGPAENPTELEPDNINVNKWTDTTWPLVMGLRSIGSADLDGEAVGRRGSIATQDLTSCSRMGRLRVVSKTPNCSWETAL